MKLSPVGLLVALRLFGQEMVVTSGAITPAPVAQSGDTTAPFMSMDPANAPVAPTGPIPAAPLPFPPLGRITRAPNKYVSSAPLTATLVPFSPPVSSTSPLVTPMTPPVVPPSTTVTGTPVSLGTPAPVSTPTSLGTPAPVSTPTSVGTPAPVSAPTSVGTPAPVSTPTSVGTPAPVSAPTSVGTPAPVSAPTSVGTPAPVSAPVSLGTPAPVSLDTPVPLGSGISMAPTNPSCTALDGDPYQYWGNGTILSCCETDGQCLDDWNNNSRVYYKCVTPGTCLNKYGDVPPEVPAVCTNVHDDPYQVFGNGTIIPCCNPSKQCLNTWDNDGRSYYKCTNQCAIVDPAPPTCTTRDQDPYQMFNNGTKNTCCGGLNSCLDDWNNDDRYYYRCLYCCGEKCTNATDLPSPTSNLTGIPSSEIGNFVETTQFGVFVSKSSVTSPPTSGSVIISTSTFGLLAVTFASLWLL